MNITKEEVQQVLDALTCREDHPHWCAHCDDYVDCSGEVVTLLQSKLAECPHGVDDGACKECYNEAVETTEVCKCCGEGTAYLVMALHCDTCGSDYGAEDEVNLQKRRTHPAKQVPSAAMQLVTKQADDEGLWFEALTAPEAHLQAALRKLHAAVESSQKQMPMTDEQAAAIRTLTFLGYTYHGAEHWKPPLGVGK